jgi:hypothetical protein
MKYIRILLVLVATSFVFSYGVAVGKYQIFPFSYIAKTKEFFAVSLDNLGRKELPNVVQPTAGIDEVFEFVFLGNSLTHHAPNPDLGWTGNYGMAASAIEHDYVHKFLSIVDTRNAYVANMYPIEKDISQLTVVVDRVRPAIQNSSTIVIQLGDNTNANKNEELNALQASIEDLARLRKPNQLLFCISTYWRSEVKDRIIKDSCEANGGNYVFIGDIFDYQSAEELPYFNHPGVNKHPKDTQMTLIAQRVYSAILQEVGY